MDTQISYGMPGGLAVSMARPEDEEAEVPGVGLERSGIVHGLWAKMGKVPEVMMLPGGIGGNLPSLKLRRYSW